MDEIRELLMVVDNGTFAEILGLAILSIFLIAFSLILFIRSIR